MRWLEGQHPEPEDSGSWMPFVWTLVVVVSAITAATLALPTYPPYDAGPITARSAFRPEWLVLATLLVLPVYRGSRISWRAALLVVPIASIEALYVADTAVDTLQRAGFTSVWYSAWYALAFAQVALFIGAGAVGAARHVADRRWVRMMRKATSLPAPRRPASGLARRERDVAPRRPEDGRAAS